MTIRSIGDRQARPFRLEGLGRYPLVEPAHTLRTFSARTECGNEPYDACRHDEIMAPRSAADRQEIKSRQADEVFAEHGTSDVGLRRPSPPIANTDSPSGIGFSDSWASGSPHRSERLGSLLSIRLTRLRHFLRPRYPPAPPDGPVRGSYSNSNSTLSTPGIARTTAPRLC